MAIIYDVVGDHDRTDVNAVVESVATVETTLEALGHRVERIRVSDGVPTLVKRLERFGPDVVFNLAECYRGKSAGEASIAGLLDLLGLPYTGSGPVALSLALDKSLSKRLFQAAGIPTPAFSIYMRDARAVPPSHYPVILKLVSEDASVGLRPDNVVADDRAFVRRLNELFEEYDGAVMAEAFIDGREFTVPLLDGEPIAFEEIEFSVEPRIVCYAAKWDTGSREFLGTTPQFSPLIDPEARETILELARRVHRLIGMRDYSRVDLRLDANGQAFVLEANPNPDITPGSGYCRALETARIPYSDFIARLIGMALQHPRVTNRIEAVPEEG